MIIVNATDLKNNLGKYLRLSAGEEIIITSNGRRIARLSAYENIAGAGLKPAPTGDGPVREQAQDYDSWPRKATYEEFLELTENSDERYEYIDGEIYLLASPKTIHQTILGELYGIFHNWFQGKKCRPMFAPYDITLRRNPENINIVQPDLMVICDLEENLNEKDYYMGVPILMVEIISESSRSKDFVKKLDLYMDTGVKEYWVINPFSREVSIYLFDQGDISRTTSFKNNETISSYSFAGLEVSLDKLFA